MARLFIADESDLMRQGYRQYLRDCCEPVGETNQLALLVSAVLQAAPEILIVHWGMVARDPGVLRTICGALPGVRVLVTLDQADQFFEALQSDAHGFHLRHTTGESLPACVMAFQKSGYWIGPLLAEYLIAGDGRSIITKRTTPAFDAGFTPTEARLADLLVAGFSNAEIGETLKLDATAVRANLRNMTRKLKVRGRHSLTERLKQTYRASEN